MHARLELLWRAVTNRTLPSFRAFYARHPLPFFRFEHRMRGDCTPLRLVAELPAPAASLQANSAVPNWVFTACAAEVSRLGKLPWVALHAEGANGSSSSSRELQLPWVPHSTKTRRR